jgi:hypothetical protein
MERKIRNHLSDQALMLPCATGAHVAGRFQNQHYSVESIP